MRPSFFPRDTHVFATLEISGWRSLSRNVLAMGALTGLLLRALRAFALTQSSGVATTAAAFTLGAAIILGMLTLHLANFPVRRWPWRVAAFAIIETATEMLVSAALIALHREPLGTTGRATWNDLSSMAVSTLEWRIVPLAIFAVVLAGVVQLVRKLLPRHVPHPSAAPHHPPTPP